MQRRVALIHVLSSHTAVQLGRHVILTISIDTLMEVAEATMMCLHSLVGLDTLVYVSAQRV